MGLRNCEGGSVCYLVFCQTQVQVELFLVREGENYKPIHLD